MTDPYFYRCSRFVPGRGACEGHGGCVRITYMYKYTEVIFQAGAFWRIQRGCKDHSSNFLLQYVTKYRDYAFYGLTGVFS